MLDDPAPTASEVTRLVLCPRQALLRHRRPRAAAPADSVAVARLEQLYPFPVKQAARARRLVPEPRARSSGRRRSRRTWAPGADPASARGGRRRRRPLRYVGRPWRASPSEGYPTAHAARAGPDRARRPTARAGLPELAGAGGGCRSTAALASLGPCFRAWAMICLRCLLGDAAPDIESRQGDPDRPHLAYEQMVEARHGPHPSRLLRRCMYGLGRRPRLRHNAQAAGVERQSGSTSNPRPPQTRPIRPGRPARPEMPSVFCLTSNRSNPRTQARRGPRSPESDTPLQKYEDRGSVSRTTVLSSRPKRGAKLEGDDGREEVHPGQQVATLAPT